MATPQGGLIRQFTSAMLDRITGRTPPTRANPGAGTGATDAQMRDAFTPATQFFPSGMPIKPTAPAQVAGRARDFPPYINLSYAPRSEQGDNAIDFKTLIRMASPADGGLDLLRLAIETRKDQMAAQRWSIRGKKKNDDGGPKARQFEAWLAKPDGVHTFRQWMRMLLEDHFVIDAPALYISQVGGRPLWEVIDGQTIKLLITADDGRTPLPPLPAYQQILVGLPACDYTVDELGYYAYNLLPRRMYGMSRVEQCLVTIRTALERAVSQLSYYSEGTTPDGFMELPKDFTLEQVQQWTEWFNSELAGQSGERHKIRFVLQDSKYTATKTEILKDSFDEWLARIICFCFSLSPQALVKEMNRATSQTAKQSAHEEGLEPTKLWFKDTMDDLLVRSGNPTLEWQWEDEEIVDPDLKAKVIQSYYGGSTGTAKAIITLAEARQMGGFPPATPEQILELQPPAPEPLDPSQNPPLNGKDPKNPKPPKSDTTKLYDKARQSSGGRSLPPLPRNAKRHERTRAGIERIARRVLTAQRQALAAAIALLPERSAKVAGFEKSAADDIKDLLAAIEDGTLAWDDDARAEVRTLIEALATEYAEDAVHHVGEYLADAEMEAILTQANERAVAWAEDRVGNMITDVSAATRDAVNELNAAAIEHGWTNDEFAAQLSDVFGFSDERAEMIARTETAFAETAGTLEGYKASGVVEGKEWSADGEACEDCLPLDGVVVGLDEDFPDDGGDGPPLHPNCMCSVAPVVSEEALAGVGADDE